jgi:hypothetical protein
MLLPFVQYACVSNLFILAIFFVLCGSFAPFFAFSLLALPLPLPFPLPCQYL